MARNSAAPIIALALVLAASPGCTCAWFAPSAKGERRVGPHDVTLQAQAHRSIGVDGIGAPHVGGILWPTIDGYGLTVRASVGGRPEVAVLAKGAAELPNKAELAAVVAAIELDASPDGKHFAYRRLDGGWAVLHLLPLGTPFDSDLSAPTNTKPVEGANVDWASLPSPEAIALAALHDAAGGYGKRHVLLWDAILAQPPGPPWDDALISGPFPSAKRAREWAIERFEQKPAPPPAWREAAARRAVAALGDDTLEKDTMDACVDVALKADLPGERDALDRTLATVWRSSARPVRVGEAFALLGARLNVCASRPWAKRQGPLPSPEARRLMVDAARALVEQKKERSAAAEIILAAGSDGDRGWLDDALLAAWPESEQESPTLAERRELREQLVAFARGGPSSRCHQPRPAPSAAWRARLRDKARPLLASEEQGHDAASMLVALGEQPDLDAGLDHWLEHSFDPVHDGELLANATRGSAAWRARATTKAEAMRAEAATQLGSRHDPDLGARLSAASSLLYRLEYESADCERLALLRAKVQRHDKPEALPKRCPSKK